MIGAAVAAHAVLVLLLPLAGLASVRREPLRLLWPALGLLAVTFASAVPAGAPARAVLGLAIALSADGLITGLRGLSVTSAVAAGALVSLAVGLMLGVERYVGFTLYSVVAALAVLAPSAFGSWRRSRPPIERLAVTTAALAVCAPLLDLSLPLARLAPWATLPHAAVLVAVVASRQGRRAGDRVLAARLERAERELGFARRTGAAAIVCAAAVHELKGLLASLRVASQFAAASADPDAKDRALALLVEALGDGQGRAAGLLGELERSEREEPRGVEVVALLEEVSRACPRAASQPTAGLVVEAPRDLAVRARRGEIELALGCLVRNALSASAPGATVWLRGMECEGGAQIEVSDAAGGIPLDLRAGLFEAPEAPREGLGLLLASRLFEQNGGRVEYLSAQGASCFRVFLPALVDAACEPLL